MADRLNKKNTTLGTIKRSDEKKIASKPDQHSKTGCANHVNGLFQCKKAGMIFVAFKVEVKQSVKFTSFSKVISTLIKKIYNKHD